MLSGLVGSEMCIRDSTNTTPGKTLYDDAGNVTTTTAANTENDTDIEAGAETASAFVDIRDICSL